MSEGLRERRRAASRAITVEVALRLFSERGFENVTVADICSAAEIAPRTFFRYFATKEEVLAEPSREMAVRIREFFATAPLELDDIAVLTLALHDLAEHVIEHSDQLRGFHRASAVRVSPYVRLSDRERQLAVDLVNRAVPEGPEGPVLIPDWRTRLMVAQGVAAFRVWMEDALGPDAPADPQAHLSQILDLGAPAGALG
ncbi:TetR family transcriptional regulator [Kineosporia rhizophila]|uniref:TetR family transcriptional regulator n=1 Tax=Kineosporia TaxID=49184 RepID=UPI001E2F2D07|nr:MULTISPECIES: TetR family transcriptional regulator [Kineosporia]MCE0535596.1 TetR family transcriptional regulator [Kineosporia rhizophila]GLY17761.1 TetR family transcriptional regulator [Kineosporia sp. NBRC 101677]